MSSERDTATSQVLLDNVLGLPKSILTQLKVLVDAVTLEQENVAEAEQIREVVPIEKWLNSSYYLGDMSRSLYPYWKREIADFVEGGYNEWVITGAIGTGKSTAALVTSLRKIYELSCYDPPQRLFRLADVSKIFFVYFSINERQAELTGFGQLRDTVDDIPYFRENYPRNLGVDSILKFPNRVFYMPGSDILHVAGTNLLCALLDETNFYRAGGMGSVGDLNKATKMYSEVTDRRKSRYLYKGQDPGFSLLVSSSTHESSFTASRIKLRDETCKVTLATPWAVKPEGTYSDRRFFVFKGSKKVDPFVVDDPSDIRNIIDSMRDRKRIELAVRTGNTKEDPEDRVRTAVEALPHEMRVQFIAVPTDFRKNFETHIFTALRNLAGVSTSPGGKLFTAKHVMERNYKPYLFHPFSKTEIGVSVRQPGDIQDYFLERKFFQREGDLLFPRRHPGEKRFIHIDQSTTTDCTGIACVHKAGYVVDEADNMVLPIIETDFILRIKPPKKPDKISIAKVRKFVFWLRSNNVHLGFVSYDQHQSEESLQTLEAHRIPCGRVSVDKDDKMWLDVCDLLYESRVQLYPYSPLETEFFSLDHDTDKHKVDHPAKNEDGSPGSKDVADAWVGAIFSCINKSDHRGLQVKEMLDSVDISFAADDSDETPDMSWVVGDPKRKGLTEKALEDIHNQMEIDTLDFWG